MEYKPWQDVTGIMVLDSICQYDVSTLFLIYIISYWRYIRTYIYPQKRAATYSTTQFRLQISSYLPKWKTLQDQRIVAYALTNVRSMKYWPFCWDHLEWRYGSPKTPCEFYLHLSHGAVMVGLVLASVVWLRILLWKCLKWVYQRGKLLWGRLSSVNQQGNGWCLVWLLYHLLLEIELNQVQRRRRIF